MNARTVPNRARAPRKQSPKSHRPGPSRSSQPANQWLVLEIWIKIIAQVLLSIAAIGAIAKLIPYQQVQQAKLEEVRLAVAEKEARVNELREQFSRNFDPDQAKQVMGEQSPRRDPNQRRIFWVSR
ncbi:hypothetical protein V0288_08240 [Pannus brasiliensis CCIBt3594]|uniref:Cell division protein FtsL n=1 Tax=Pannus brasiliensis CCIBt3594 TaxID=1427578 RepID=A0AAW9QPU2_9CHRO